MILVGSYADGLATVHGDHSPIRLLSAYLDAIVPDTVGVHLLPFYPSHGDFGFAIDDWFSVRPELGTWTEISSLGKRRRLVVDGVYNHIGMGHEWVSGFFESPDTFARLLHAYRVPDDSLGPRSPRGRPVLTAYQTRSEIWHLWHTFTPAAVDIRLTSPEVIAEVARHLQWLSLNAVWGVRLDAVAYYAKWLGSKVRHNAGVHDLADLIAELVRQHDMRVLAQLDCDSDGQRYFEYMSSEPVVVNDFSYATHLALSILSGNPSSLARHLLAVSRTGRLCMRSPRNHDGLLLRSGFLSKPEQLKLIQLLTDSGVGLRFEGDSPYEFNCSGPYICGLAGGESRRNMTIEFEVAVTGMTSGWSYFYLPFLIGYIPEVDPMSLADDDDPRALNRSPVTEATWKGYVASPARERIWRLLEILSDIHTLSGSARGFIALHDNRILELISGGGRYKLLANFSHVTSWTLPASLHRRPVWGTATSCRKLGPLEYCIWEI